MSTVRRCGLVLVLAAAALVPVAAGAHPSLEALRSEIETAAAGRPEAPAVLLRRAQLHRVAGEWDAALRELDHAAARGADADVVGATRGLVLLDAGRPRAAKRALDAVLARRPELAAVRFARGRAWLGLEQPKKAARDFGRAFPALPQPTPDHVIVHRDALLAAGRPREALGALDAGMVRVGRVAALVLAAVDLELALGRAEAALVRLDGLLAQAPANPAWLARRGDLLAGAGRPDDARLARVRALAALDARPAGRRGGRLDDLERRLRADLAPPKETP